MKILYIGHYKEFGGWAQAATDYILALDAAGVDVVCRNVTLTKDKENVNTRLLELEKKDSFDCDICIQHVLPHHLVKYNSFKKNIGFLASESTSIKHLNWFDQIQLMDELWVPNSQSKQFLEEDGIKIPVKVVPHTFNLDKYKKRYQEIVIPETQDNFVFYYVGDLNDRKNLDSTLNCFYSEFERSENVSLVLKVNKFAKSNQEIENILNNKMNKIKNDLRLYDDPKRYKKCAIIPGNITEDQISSLHQYCDCFLGTSHGEAWSIPAFEAMCFGNTPICSNFGGPRDFIDRNNWRTGHLINGVFTVCKCSDAAFPDMFTGREYWFQPSEMDIRNQMRKSYESWSKDKLSYKIRNQAEGLKRAENFSYDNIGKLMKGIINE